jgi:8-oxo-dGTP pyrophosphatase MutT (NUDIX family)
MVVGAIVLRHRRVLLCHRTPDRSWYPDVWDLPGGHVEAGESDAGALVRELREELGITVPLPTAPEFSRLAADGYSMGIWVVTEWAGTPTNCSPDEHDDLAWFTSGELADLSLAEPSYPELVARALGRSRRRGGRKGGCGRGA